MVPNVYVLRSSVLYLSASCVYAYLSTRSISHLFKHTMMNIGGDLQTKGLVMSSRDKIYVGVDYGTTFSGPYRPRRMARLDLTMERPCFCGA